MSSTGYLNEKAKMRKLILGLILCGIIVLGLGFLFLRLRNSVVVKADERKSFLGEIAAYRQDDERWSADLLGNSSYTMESSGCLVTCIASAISMEKGKEITPGELNKIFSKNNVFDAEGNILWAGIESIDRYSVIVFEGVSESEIYQCLDEGHFPIVRVRVNGLGNFHYVLIVGVEDNEYICMDPLKDELTKLSDYMNRVYAVRVVYGS